MTVKELIEDLKKYNEDKIVILGDNEGWSNIDCLKEDISTVCIIEDKRY